MSQQLKHHVAIVTGGSRGIGRACAVRLAREGADVAISYNTSPDKAQRVAAIVEGLGQRALALQCDVSNSRDVKSFVKAVWEEFGRVDILVNNAGITKDTLILRMSEQDWDAVINTNLRGAFLFSREVVKIMLQNGHGKIINIGSIVGESGNPGQANYVASKAGLVGLTKALARELAPKHIQVNVIAPGFVATDMTADLNDEVKEALLGGPLKRGITRPEKIADFAAFLASPASELITGQTFVAEATHAQWKKETRSKRKERSS